MYTAMGNPTLSRPADVIDIGGQGSFPLSFDLSADLFQAGVASKIVTFVPNREPYSSYLHQTLSIKRYWR